MTALERLTEDESQWGKSRIDYAYLERKKLRDLERFRRAQYLTRNVVPVERDPKGRYLPADRRGPVEGEVFETSSGLKAYVCKVSDPVSISTATVETSERFSLVSLPYVSIQHGVVR